MFKYFYYMMMLFLAASCISNKKTIYLQDPRVNYTDTISTNYNFIDYKINPKDLLSIKVLGMDPKTTNFFNSDFGTMGNNPMMLASAASAYLAAYVVDDSGYVYMPVLGMVYVKGLTVDKVQKKIEALVNEHVETASVFVKLVNYKITLLGDIKTPGLYYVYNPRINIFEALAMGGDLTELANRKRIKLVRIEEGKIESIYLDILDPNIFNSKYYFIKPNDVIYVENYKVKPFRSNITSIGFVVGLVSTFFVILTYIKVGTL